MKMKKSIPALTALFLMAGAYIGGSAAADMSHHQSEGGEEKSATDHMEMMRKMEEQMQHQAMMARVDSLNARLEEKLARAKKARGDKKVDALMAVVEELVAQRKTMHHQMIGYMETGMMMGMHESMQSCPMMKGMHGESTEGSQEDHSGHHPGTMDTGEGMGKMMQAMRDEPEETSVSVEYVWEPWLASQ